MSIRKIKTLKALKFDNFAPLPPQSSLTAILNTRLHSSMAIAVHKYNAREAKWVAWMQKAARYWTSLSEHKMAKTRAHLRRHTFYTGRYNNKTKEDTTFLTHRIAGHS